MRSSFASITSANPDCRQVKWNVSWEGMANDCSDCEFVKKFPTRGWSDLLDGVLTLERHSPDWRVARFHAGEWLSRASSSGTKVAPKRALVGELKRRLGCDAPHDFPADLIERQDSFSQPGARHIARHAPDDTACLVLDDHGGASRAKRFAPF